MNKKAPLVSILTPVYNGERYISECIESIIKQKFSNWEYLIVNNCSTDKTLDIAMQYAEIDPRIKIVNNNKHVSCEENHNIAFSLICNESKYCKVVSADDYLFPNCIDEMVRIAELYPTAGIIGSYQVKNGEIIWDGLPADIQFISGKEVCRLSLVNHLSVFGNPTSSMYKSSIVRKKRPFFPNLLPYADVSVCYKVLIEWDYAFVHKALSIERVHDGQLTTGDIKLGTGTAAYFDNLCTYGPYFLSEAEFLDLKEIELNRYYQWLGGALLKLKAKQFWEFHKRKVEEHGFQFNWRKVIRGSLSEIIIESKNPNTAIKKLFNILLNRYLEYYKRNKYLVGQC